MGAASHSKQRKIRNSGADSKKNQAPDICESNFAAPRHSRLIRTGFYDNISFNFANSDREVGAFSITMPSPNWRSNSFCSRVSFCGVCT